jgi:hypothetical protein
MALGRVTRIQKGRSRFGFRSAPRLPRRDWGELAGDFAVGLSPTTKGSLIGPSPKAEGDNCSST